MAIIRARGSSAATALTPPNTQASSYTLALSDAGKAVEIDSMATMDVIVPSNSTAAFPVGTVIDVTRLNAGMVNIVASSGVLLKRPDGSQLTPRARNSTARLRKRNTNEWVVSGDLQGEAEGPRTLFSESFETGNFIQWKSCQWTGRLDDCSSYNGSADYSATVVSVDDRLKVARFEVRDGDVPPFGGGERAEIGSPGPNLFSDQHVHEGDERWISFDMKLDVAFPNPAGWGGVLWQMHPESGTASPPLVLNITTGGNLTFGNNDLSGPPSVTDLGPAPKGSWHRYVIHAKFSTSDSVGFRELWVDGVHAVPKIYHKTMIPGDTYNYMKIGHYRDNPSTGTAIVYFDNLKITGPPQVTAARWSGADGSRYVTTTNLPSPASDLTVLCWARPAAAFTDATCIWTFDDGAYNQWFLLGGSQVILQTNGANIGNHVPTANTWYKYAVVKAGTTGSLYVGDAISTLTLNATGTVHELTNGIARFYVAGSDAGEQSFNGRIANLKVYTAALTQAECETELNQYAPARTANLLRRHPFNEMTTYDFTGSGSTFTVLGAAPVQEDGPPIF